MCNFYGVDEYYLVLLSVQVGMLVVIRVSMSICGQVFYINSSCERVTRNVQNPQQALSSLLIYFIRRGFSAYKIQTHPIRIVLFEKTLIFFSKIRLA